MTFPARDGKPVRTEPPRSDSAPFQLGTRLLGMRTRLAADAASVELVGELCVYSAPSLDVHLQVLIAFGRTEVALDASRLELLGAAGVRVLIENSHRCAAGGGRLRISAASPHVCRVLSVCELTERFGLGARDPDAPVLGPSRLRRGFADVRRAS